MTAQLLLARTIIKCSIIKNSILRFLQILDFNRELTYEVKFPTSISTFQSYNILLKVIYLPKEKVEYYENFPSPKFNFPW